MPLVAVPLIVNVTTNGPATLVREKRKVPGLRGASAAVESCAVTLTSARGRSVIVTPRSIDRCVATLRAKIETDRHRPTYIRTIRDIGYRFEPEEAV